jgi:excisionase family DNA binding protein
MVKALFRIDEAGDALGFKRSKTYELVRRGELRVVHVDGVTRIPASAITEFVERLEADEESCGVAS